MELQKTEMSPVGQTSDDAPATLGDRTDAANTAEETEAIDTSGTGQTLDAGDADLARITRLAWAEVQSANDPPTLFLYGNDPVRLEHRESETVRLVPLTPGRLRHDIAEFTRWSKETGRGQAACRSQVHPPGDVIQNMLAAPSIPLPRLTRIVACPTFGAEGALHETPGYSTETKTYYAPLGFAQK